MASTYAHYRFGQEVLKVLPEETQKIVKANKGLYDIGLHGPDILFYYKPLCKNYVNQTGYGLHGKPAKNFFKKAAKTQKTLKGRDQEALLAYLYGFICHFALDSSCHTYIAEKMKESGISHAEIEVEFDRSLMVQDGLDPVRQKLTSHIVPSKENARIIACAFPGITKEQVEKALKSTVYYNNLLVAPERSKRMLINGLLRIAGQYKKMHGLMVNLKPNEACKDSNAILKTLYTQGLSRAVVCIENFNHYLAGTENLNKEFDKTFGAEKG